MYTVCIRDLDKLNLAIWWFDFRLEPNSGNDLSALKFLLTLKSFKSDTKVIISLLLVISNSLIHSVVVEVLVPKNPPTSDQKAALWSTAAAAVLYDDLFTVRN